MIKIYLYNTSLILLSNNVYDITNNVNECDFIFLSYKIRAKQTGIRYVDENNVPIISEAYKLALENNKKLVYYCGGDVPPKILPNNNNIIVLNTSVNALAKPFNEYVVGSAVEDKFKAFIEKPKLNIGFVGQKLHNRQKYLDFLSRIDGIETNFILRETYIHKLKHRHIRDFENNMNNNLFTFCYRGRGNFSVRFYETLMRGRIPIVIKTNNVFPFEDIIDYSKIGLFIDEKELDKNMDLDKRICNYFNSKTEEDLINIQRNNRELYLKYFHPNTYFESIFKYMKNIITNH